MSDDLREAVLHAAALEAMSPEDREQYVSRDAEGELLRRQAAARKDSSMLGESGYERIEADFYPTPPENVDCLLANILLDRVVWEPACGNGAISKRLAELGHTVISTDLHDQGYGEAGMDFLDQIDLPTIGRYADDGPAYAVPKAIVTNPPYGELVEKFINKALDLMEPVRGQVAMFLRNEYDCGSRRMSLFGMPPFHKKIVVTKRPRWIEGSTGSPRHNYAWFVWDWRHIKGPASIVYSHPSSAQPSRVQ